MDLQTFLTLVEQSSTTADVVNEYIEKAKPGLYKLGDEILSILNDLVENDEYYSTVAKGKAKMFNALCHEGFTRDEALSIMIANEKALKETLKNTKVNTKTTV